MNDNQEQIPGLLDPTAIDLIKAKYKLEIDTDNVREYRLCLVIAHLENKLREVSRDFH